MTTRRTPVTRIHWAIIIEDSGLIDVYDYDDEQDARDHLPRHPGGYLATCEVTQMPWKRVDS